VSLIGKHGCNLLQNVTQSSRRSLVELLGELLVKLLGERLRGKGLTDGCGQQLADYLALDGVSILV